MCNSNLVFKTRHLHDIRLQKMSWPWNRGQRSLKVIESCTIRKIVYGFLLLFFSNTDVKTQRYWDIRLQNCRHLENRVKGPSRSLQMSQCDRAHMTSYWCTIVTMALSRVVSEIFNVKKCCDLEIGVKCHSRSWRVVLFDRLCVVSYSCSLVTLSLKCTDFEIFDFQNAMTLKTGLEVRQGHWKYHLLIERIWLPIDVL